jgi:hypothetical protein
MLRGGEQPVLKSAITVERGVYKQEWERDFFRDILPAERPVEAADAAAATPDDAALVPDTDNMRPRRVAPSLRKNGAKETHIEERSAVEEPPVAVEPPPPEQLLLPPRRPEPTIVPDQPRETVLPAETAPQAPSIDTKKKQKERARELDSKRKKGNFRDPKITY